MAKNDGEWTTTRETGIDITLRDFFAGMMMAGFGASEELQRRVDDVFGGSASHTLDMLAGGAYKAADAMLKERENGNEASTG